MNDDWRVTVEVEDTGGSQRLLGGLAARELEEAEHAALGDHVVVSHDGPRVFLYTDTEDRARAAQEVARKVLDEHGWSGEVSVTRWHPIAEEWADPSIPLPQTPEEIAAEHARDQEEETEDSITSGVPEWEVSIVFPHRRQAVEFAERLRADGLNPTRRWRYLVLGANNEDEANALADRMRAEATEAESVSAEGTLEFIQAARPFRIFRGFG